MAKSITGTTKKRGRPPTTGRGAQIGMRWQAGELAAIDAWIEQRPNVDGRPQAIRQLVQIGLSADKPHRSSAKTRTRAAELAGAAIDKASDPTATDEERSTRKRRVLDGPSMARKIRKDRP